MADWQPIATCPETGFFLLHEKGAIRAMVRMNGKWEHPCLPVLIRQTPATLATVCQGAPERKEKPGGATTPTISFCPIRSLY